MLNAFRQYPPAHARCMGASEFMGPGGPSEIMGKKKGNKKPRKSSIFSQSNHREDAGFEILQSSRWHPLVFELDLPDLDQIKKNI